MTGLREPSLFATREQIVEQAYDEQGRAKAARHARKAPALDAIAQCAGRLLIFGLTCLR
jgi:hypothetical protein